jgi:uncharacterized protein YueI
MAEYNEASAVIDNCNENPPDDSAESRLAGAVAVMQSQQAFYLGMLAERVTQMTTQAQQAAQAEGDRMLLKAHGNNGGRTV